MAQASPMHRGQPVGETNPACWRADEGVSVRLGRWIAREWYCRARPSLRSWLRRLVMRLERGPVYSRSIREILERHHGVLVGMYTIGPCESDPSRFAPGTVIGRYCSVYYTARVLSADGPSPALFEGGPAWDPVEVSVGSGMHGQKGVIIGHDVYIGHNALILPTVRMVGHGAVIGAGSVVQEDVPPYAVVTGNPGRVVRYRFRPATIEKLLAEQWWLKTIDEILASGWLLQRPVEAPGAGAAK